MPFSDGNSLKSEWQAGRGSIAVGQVKSRRFGGGRGIPLKVSLWLFIFPGCFQGSSCVEQVVSFFLFPLAPFLLMFSGRGWMPLNPFQVIEKSSQMKCWAVNRFFPRIYIYRKGSIEWRVFSNCWKPTVFEEGGGHKNYFVGRHLKINLSFQFIIKFQFISLSLWHKQ